MTDQTASTNQSPATQSLPPAVIAVPVGQAALTALGRAVERAQSGDPFARVVVVADHIDAASSVRHWLGALGVVNVTVQTGGRLAADLAQPGLRPAGATQTAALRPLTRTLESQAVRQVADAAIDSAGLPLSPAGRRRLCQSIAAAFREMQERPRPHGADASTGAAPFNSTPIDIEKRFGEYRALLRERGYYTRGELPELAAVAVDSHWSPGDLPATIYYLPRRFTAPEMRLVRALLDQDRCQVIIGLTNDADADAPVVELATVLGAPDSGIADQADRHHLQHPLQPQHLQPQHPLQQKADAGTLSIVAAPDPTEEVRAVVRRIASDADAAPFYRTAIVHRQLAPYASLLRQELTFAGIPFAGLERRTLADTLPGRLLLGLVDLAVAGGPEPNGNPGTNGNPRTNGTVDRERLIDWLTSAPVKYQTRPAAGDGPGRWRTTPAAGWAQLARNARANGPAAQWTSRLKAHIDQQQRRAAYYAGVNTSAGDGDGDGAGDAAGEHPQLQRDRHLADELSRFVNSLAWRLRELANPPDPSWESVAALLNQAFDDYRWREPGQRDDNQSDDNQRIRDAVDALANLADWDTDYSIRVLQETIHESLQTPVSDRGRPVGAGVYIGPPAGIVGIRYQTVYMVGLIEGEFPPRPRSNPWLHDDAARLRHDTALERYDFLGALAAADEAVLCYPAVREQQYAAHPSRWLTEAANGRHHAAGNPERLTYETLTADADARPWLTVIPSRESGLRQLSAHANGHTPATQPATVQPADGADYNLMHLIAHPRLTLAAHPAVQQESRLVRALEGRLARRSNLLTEWDGRVGEDVPRMMALGTRQQPVSASRLEMWARCPYQYFLSRSLGLEGLPEAEAEEISALDRGSLVHRILERFVGAPARDLETLLAVAVDEFAAAEQQGITGYHLLWEIQQATIRDRLAELLAAETEWLGDVNSVVSAAEVSFGPGTGVGEVSVAVHGLGDVWFRGAIDRLDVLPDSVRVRDFKTGAPGNYLVGKQGGPPKYSVGNGQALQLPIYLAAAEALRRQGVLHWRNRRLQLPIYLAAAETLHSNLPAEATYCFPLDQSRPLGHDPYTNTVENAAELHATLSAIVGTARRGIFPAAPDSDGGRGGNCQFCNFNRLCPVRRYHTWENKRRNDPDVQQFNALKGLDQTPDDDQGETDGDS